MGSTLDRAAVEYDSGEDDDNDRILHTTDVTSLSAPTSTGHKSKGNRLKHKAREILHVNSPRTVVTEPADGVTLAPLPNPAAMPYRLDSHPPDKGLDGLKDFAHQPIQTIKAKAKRRTNREVAKNLATAEISHAYDVELVLAQDHMASADTKEEQSSAHQDLEVLKKARQDMFIRWTIDRHVLKIRRLERIPIQPRERAEFTTKDQSEHDKTSWKTYVGHLALRYSERYGGQYIGSFAEPPLASQETMSASIERLLVASTPWQEVIMHVRRIYRWENQTETLTYLAIFLSLWVFNCVAAGILLATIVQVLSRRLHTPTIERLREHIIRTENSAMTALTLTEQIEKRGEHGWIEPLIKEMGPWMLLQLGDTANLLEVVLNFYEWRQPRQTAYTLSLMIIGFLAFYLTPSWLLVKFITLSIGLVFFGLFPIGSRYPDYRLLASPMKWLFWNIPNHAEWAIARLQIEGARQMAPGVHQEKPVDLESRVTPQESGGLSMASLGTASKSSAVQDCSPEAVSGVSSGATPTDESARVPAHGSYKCTSEKHSGRLFVTSLGVRFETNVGVRGQWQIRYDNMNRVEKVRDSDSIILCPLTDRKTPQKINRIVKVGSGQDILFIDGHGQSFWTANVVNRNEVFTQVIGYSNVHWQVIG